MTKNTELVILNKGSDFRECIYVYVVLHSCAEPSIIPLNDHKIVTFLSRYMLNFMTSSDGICIRAKSESLIESIDIYVYTFLTIKAPNNQFILKIKRLTNKVTCINRKLYCNAV